MGDKILSCQQSLWGVQECCEQGVLDLNRSKG